MSLRRGDRLLLFHLASVSALSLLVQFTSEQRAGYQEREGRAEKGSRWQLIVSVYG